MDNQKRDEQIDYFSNELEKEDFIDTHLPSKPHLRERHLHVTDSYHTKRIADAKKAKHPKHSSSFLSEETMQEEIKACLRDDRNMNRFINWLNSDKRELNLKIQNKRKAIGSGIGIDKHTKRLTEYTTKTTEVRLLKDASKPDGFVIITAFPVLTHNPSPTGRNISHLIKDTDLYQNASKIEQVGMDIANDPLFDPKTMNIRTTKDKIQLQEQPCESEITYKTVTYLPDKTQVRTTKPKLYQLAKNAAKELGIKTPIKDIIKNAIKEAITKIIEKVIKRKPKDATPPDEIRSQPETQTKKPEPDIDDPNDKQEHEKETVETRSAPKIFRNSNNMINPEDDIELYEDLEPYDPLGHNTDPEHTEYMQKLITKANPHHNDHTQVPEGKYNLPDNNKELMDELNQSVERMEKRTKDGKFGLGE